MKLREALCQISEIRQQMAGSEIFHGFRSTTVALPGGLALLAVPCQPWVAGSTANDLDRYLMLWTGVATVSGEAAALGQHGRRVAFKVVDNVPPGGRALQHR